jgi:GNAT superfamily N-acetyltransferase
MDFMIEQLIIRRGSTADITAIVQANIDMAMETERKLLDYDTVLNGVTSVIEDCGKGFYLVAELNEKTIGQLMITTEWSDWRNKTFWWIQSVFVHRDFRRQGVFSQLYHYLLQMQEKENPPIAGLRLYVEENNAIAKQVYQTLGMKHSYYHLYEQEF